MGWVIPLRLLQLQEHLRCSKSITIKSPAGREAISQFVVRVVTAEAGGGSLEKEALESEQLTCCSDRERQRSYCWTLPALTNKEHLWNIARDWGQLDKFSDILLLRIFLRSVWGEDFSRAQSKSDWTRGEFDLTPAKWGSFKGPIEKKFVGKNIALQRKLKR